MFIIGKMSKRVRWMLLIAAGLLAILIAIEITGFGQDALSVSVHLEEDSDLARADFLAGYGWEITTVPEEICQITIPGEFDAVYEQYNQLQKAQGFDLSLFRGETVTRYTYRVNNHPHTEQVVVANLLVKDRAVIGGDICSTALDGFMETFDRKVTL